MEQSADFEPTYNSLTIESFEKPNDLDRSGRTGLCGRHAISVG